MSNKGVFERIRLFSYIYLIVWYRKGMITLCKNLADTERLAKKFLAQLALENPKRATVIGLSGDLGSGKTTFTQLVAKELGVTDEVTSPTFVIEKKYELNNSRFKYLIHIDAYRLAGGSELEVLGWRELVANPQNLIFVEWPELVNDVMPEEYTLLCFDFVNESARKVLERKKIESTVL